MYEKRLNIMNEAKELTRLMKAITKQANLDNEAYEQNQTGDFDVSDIIIIIGDEAIRLCLGCPQMTGLHKLIEHIADENFYNVDYVKDEVTE